MSAAYNSEDCVLLSKALEQAWELFLKTRGLTFDNVDTARASLTYAILDAASKGERNPRRLAFGAVARSRNLSQGFASDVCMDGQMSEAS